MSDSRLIEDLAVKWTNSDREEVRRLGAALQNLKETKDRGQGDVTVDLQKCLADSRSVRCRVLKK